MRVKILMLLSLFFLLFLPGAASADCIRVGNFDNFVLVGDDTVILYDGGMAVVKIETNCTVYERSKVRLLKNYICDGDDIRIDDKTCNMASVSSANED